MTDQEKIQQLEKEVRDLKLLIMGGLSDVDDIAQRLHFASKRYVGMGAVTAECAAQLNALGTKFRIAAAALKEMPNGH